MLFPESPRVVYKKNSLAEVICQLRFPTILRIGASELADFQDKVRQDYPLYSLQEPSIEFPQLPKELSSIIQQLNMPKPPGSTTHRFSTTDSQRFISLSQDFLALAETAYVNWNLFRGELEKAEKALREVYRPAFYSRIGLRYQNVISRKNLALADKKWEELIQTHIVAELGAREVADAIVATRTQSVIRTSDVPGGQVRLTHGLVKPPGSDEQCYLIDADFSIEQKEGLSEPFEILDRFNRLAGRLFRWAITDTLHGAMEPENI